MTKYLSATAILIVELVFRLLMFDLILTVLYLTAEPTNWEQLIASETLD